MLGIKPLLTIEDGRLIAMEKARTRAKAVEKLAEFVVEFTHIEQLAILQNTSRTTDQTRSLQDRLAIEFPDLETPVILYDRLLSTLIGPDAMGVVVYEGEEEEVRD
jgi:fatty acid-binding protein DegV